MQNIFLSLIQSTAASSGAALNVTDLILQAGWVVKIVMAMLILSSIVSWTIILFKWTSLRAALMANRRFAEGFAATGAIEAAQRAVQSVPHAPLARVFQAGNLELGHITKLNLDKAHTFELLETNLSRNLQKSIDVETAGLRSYLPFLATTASTAPFVGLFGTVWGIMTSFINIGATGASNLAVVAPGIAEALIATAIGLFAAIPAVIAFNIYTARVRGIGQEMGAFAADFMNAAKRSIG